MTGGAGFTRDSTTQFGKNRDTVKQITGRYSNRKTQKNPKKKRRKQKPVDKEILEKMRKTAVRQNQKELIIISCVAAIILGVIAYIAFK